MSEEIKKEADLLVEQHGLERAVTLVDDSITGMVEDRHRRNKLLNIHKYLCSLKKISGPTILQEAQDLVYGARAATYGHPRENFTRIATMWAAILGHPVSAQQVGLCMVAVKLARQCHKPGRDNLVDIAGYAATIEKLDETY